MGTPIRWIHRRIILYKASAALYSNRHYDPRVLYSQTFRRAEPIAILTKHNTFNH